MRRLGAAGLIATALLMWGAPSALGQTTMRWSGHEWNVYQGSGLLGQQWASSRVAVGAKHHYLHVGIAAGVGGGLTTQDTLTTGRWSVTFRMTDGPGKYAILLWPTSGPRPELDFAEDHPVDPLRRWCTATYHPAANQPSLRAQTMGNFSRWHRATILVRTSGVRVFLDGQLRGTWPAPAVPMRLALQTADPAGQTGTATLIVRSVSVTPIG